MKYFICLLIIAMLIFSCKKKKKDAETETPAPPLPQLALKINGATSDCNTCFSSYYSSGMWGVNFYLGGNNSDRLLFNFTSSPSTGTYTLVKFGNPSLTYQKDNVYYRGLGTMTITAVDTAVGKTVKTLKATFSCKTDTSNGLSFDLSGGAINVSN